MPKTLVILDGHVAGHHQFFLEMFIRAMHSEVDQTFAIGPGAEPTRERLSGKGIEIAALRRPFLLSVLYDCLRVAGCNPGSSFYVVSIILARWKLRRLKASDISVFLPYVYEEEFGKLASALFRLLGISWGGLCSEGRWVRHPEKFQRETASVFQSRALRHENFRKALHRSRVKVWGVLDEKVETALNEGFEVFLPEGGRAIRVPEVVAENEEQPISEPMRRKILEWANGRKIVSIVGFLKSGKGLVQFCELAESEPEGYCFLIAGRISWESYTAAESDLIRRTIMTCPALCAYQDNRLADEYFNAALSVADLLFMRYQDWTNSSNMLSQAVRFEVPVVVESGYLLADRVARFGLGIVVDSSSPGREILPAEPSKLSRIRETADWDGYRSEHNVGLFREVAKEMLEEIKGS